MSGNQKAECMHSTTMRDKTLAGAQSAKVCRDSWRALSALSCVRDEETLQIFTSSRAAAAAYALLHVSVRFSSAGTQSQEKLA